MEAVRIGRQPVEITRPEKVLFPKEGITKRDLIEYYQRIAPVMLPHLRGRPIAMERYPDGASGKSFFQKRVPDSAPEWLDRAIVSTPNGTTSRNAARGSVRADRKGRP